MVRRECARVHERVPVPENCRTRTNRTNRVQTVVQTAIKRYTNCTNREIFGKLNLNRFLKFNGLYSLYTFLRRFVRRFVQRFVRFVQIPYSKRILYDSVVIEMSG